MKIILMLVGLVLIVHLSGCSTFNGTQKRAFDVVQGYCDMIPDVDRNMGVRFEIFKRDGRTDEQRVSIECFGGETSHKGWAQ